jgi:nucleotide-binding universal stress UspA family protein
MTRLSAGCHILVLVDGTELSFHAADGAIDLARALGARLTALAVVDRETLHQLLSVKILVDTEMDEFEKELQDSARRHLKHVSERALDRRVAVEEVLLTGSIVEIVAKVVHERTVDLIALGGYDSGRVSRDLLARQRQSVVDNASCPVLIVK